jgi:hypothetical protein
MQAAQLMGKLVFVRFGSLADMATISGNVRFTPKADMERQT